MITINMLLYEFAKRVTVCKEKCSEPALTVNQIDLDPERILDSNELLSDCLYLLPAKELLSGGRFRSGASIPAMAVIAAETKEEIDAACRFLDKEGRLRAVQVLSGSVSDLAAAIHSVYQEQLRSLSELLSEMLTGSSDDAALNCAERFLGRPFSLIWKDFRILYQSDDAAKLSDELGRTISPEVAHDLIMDKHFHDALLQHDCFYYYNQTLDFYNYCSNIFHEQSYLARIILLLSKGETVLHRGEEERFALVSSLISRWGISRSHLFRDLMQDQLHEMFGRMIHAEKIEPETVASMLAGSGWSADDEYSVIRFRFLAGERWATHNEITFSFLSTSLEGLWPDSCAVPQKDEIIWLVNLTRTGSSPDSNDFHQALAKFIREYICIAGVSPSFHDMSQLPFAMQASEVALALGRAEDPYSWYYLYEDYRNRYILQSLKKQFPVSMLAAPELIRLQEYDRLHDAELFETLRAFLHHGHNMTTAAEAIFIHRTTFCRRMEKILELTGLNLEDGDVCSDLLLSYRLLDS